MNIKAAKVLCLLGVFFLMLVGSLLPVKIIEADYEKAHRSKKVIALCNSFGGGVFLATCFNALLPAVRVKLQEVLKLGNVTTDYPLAETIMLMGFFVTVFVEQLILTFRKEKPSFIDLETFNAGSDVGSDSEYESPFIASSRGHTLYQEHSHHSHSHGLNVQELSQSSPLRLFSLVFALSAHSIFEGLALGLQEEGSRVMSLFLGVAIHETLVAVALGISMAKISLTLKDAAKLALTLARYYEGSSPAGPSVPQCPGAAPGGVTGPGEQRCRRAGYPFCPLSCQRSQNLKIGARFACPLWRSTGIGLPFY
ncbi:zinc transporter ZIP3 isoform X2 [Carettochelys insculpta]|uniref:zinc transporter ZIP3 isoform X2 n=1 Tax=Carettochelys insculpta TaxID=44489 RepID=UPI003EBB352D